MGKKKENTVSQLWLDKEKPTLNETAVPLKGSMYEFAQEMGLSLRRQKEKNNHLKEDEYVITKANTSMVPEA